MIHGSTRNFLIGCFQYRVRITSMKNFVLGVLSLLSISSSSFYRHHAPTLPRLHKIMTGTSGTRSYPHFHVLLGGKTCAVTANRIVRCRVRLHRCIDPRLRSDVITLYFGAVYVRLDARCENLCWDRAGNGGLRAAVDAR